MTTKQIIFVMVSVGANDHSIYHFVDEDNWKSHHYDGDDYPGMLSFDNLDDFVNSKLLVLHGIVVTLSFLFRA